MSRTLFVNANVLTERQLLAKTDLFVSGGKIEAIAPGLAVADAEIIDARGLYLAPGFIDLHLHGGGGHDFMDGTIAAFLGAAKTHARHGTTTLLPTTLASTDAELAGMFETYQLAVRHNIAGALMPGLHLEGPYFAMAQKGAQDPRFIRNPDPAHYGPILEKWGHLIKRWSAAPELPGSKEFASALQEYAILPSVAHSDAFYEEIVAAEKEGFTHLTHFYSGMSGLRRIQGMRRPGVIEAGYISDSLTVEIIADGMHLPAPLLKQVYKCIGVQRTALVTDAMRAAGQKVATSLLGSLKNGQEVLIDQGVAWLPDRTAFAGSVATMDRTVRTMVQKVDVPLLEAVQMATATPADIGGFKQKGRLEPGYDADLILFDEDINIELTMIAGRLVYQKHD